MFNNYLISLFLFSPFIASLLVLFCGKILNSRKLAYYVALGASIIIFIFALLFYYCFTPEQLADSSSTKLFWFAEGISYYLAIDNISLIFILYISFIFPFLILSTSNNHSCYAYFICLLLLEFALLGVFLSRNLLLFYIFFEASLIPVFFIMFLWGGNNRFYASFKFFLYTLCGSLLMLVGMMILYSYSSSLNINELLIYDIPPLLQLSLFWLFFIAFAIKLPIFPLHSWLRNAIIEAPKEMTMAIAGILFLLGGYGILFIILPLFPLAVSQYKFFIYIISIIGVFYGFIIALCQTDAKKLMCYSLIAHMSYIVLGLFSGNIYGIEGAIFQMLAHGLIALAIFYLIGILYERFQSSDILSFSNLAKKMPKYSSVLLILIMANIGLPVTAGFVGEFLIFVSIYKYSFILSILATMGVFLSASYALWFYRGLIFRSSNIDSLEYVDLTVKEKFISYSFVAVILFFGIYPSPIFKLMSFEIGNKVYSLQEQSFIASDKIAISNYSDYINPKYLSNVNISRVR
ncbi:NuoM family protein [Bartonella sp. DGB1]|uniref:complex I subunit 4 family protein n=1 Tax=Bartonella sp. DGB1 TaxID=3239807 RepID=UPI003524C9A0